MKHLLRKSFIAGLLIWLPIASTFFVLKLLINVINGATGLLPARWHPEELLGFTIPGFGILLSVVVLILTGLLVTNIFGRQLVNAWESLINRIPMVRTVYNTVKQVLEILLSSNSRSFRQVLLIEYPRKGLWAMGFKTNESLNFGNVYAVPEVWSVFIPTTPNPTSGFVILVPKEDIRVLDMTVEEGFKWMLSLGVVMPDKFSTGDFVKTTG